MKNVLSRVFKNKNELVSTYINKNDSVLDVGFWGQGIKSTDKNWIHTLVSMCAGKVYGTDIFFDEQFEPVRKHPSQYLKANAEQFDFNGLRFDIIIASELIEHLSNPGLFLDRCRIHLHTGGKLVITTPNCFNLFNIAGKFSRQEPATNSDHTCYYNTTTLGRLLEKNGWFVDEIAYVYTLDIEYEESLKKKLLNFAYWTLSMFTTKFMETLVIVAKPRSNI